MTHSRFILSAVLTILVVGSDAQGQNDVYCDNPRTKPAYERGWIPSHEIDTQAFDSSYVFFSNTSGRSIERYTLTGADATHVTWPWQDTGVEIPFELAIHPINGDLYVAELWNGHRVSVFDVDGDGTPKAVLFSGADNPNPGGMVGDVTCLAIHPETGRLFILSEGWYADGENDPVWISRIQRFDEYGNYDNLVINNALGIGLGEPGFDQSPPVFPACGAWHYPGRIWVDKDGNLYVYEDVNSSAEMSVVHKFDDQGQCVEQKDVTGKRFHVDSDGYLYASAGSVVEKWYPDWSDTLYTIQMSAPVLAIQSMATSSDFLIAVTDMGGFSRRVQFYGPPIEALNVINEDWQDATTFQVITDDLALLTSCDSSMVQMEGVVADGVSPLLLRWKVPGPGEVEWSLQDPESSSTALMGTLVSLDSSEVDTVSIQVPVVAIGGPSAADREFFALAVYTAPVDFDRPGTLDNNTNVRYMGIVARYRPDGSPTPNLAAAEVVRVERPPVLAVHGLWSEPSAWDPLTEIREDPRWKDRWNALSYKKVNGQSLAITSPHIKGGVESLTEAMTNRSVVAARVDVLAHSNGGIMLRKFADGPEYRRADNMGRGDYHKVLFFDSPHHGSPLADIGVSLREVVEKPLKLDFLPYRMGRRGAILTLFEGVAVIFGTSYEQVTGPALDDLTTDSAELASLGEFTVPTRVHVGDASYFWNQAFPPILRQQAAAASAGAALALSLKTFLKLPGAWSLITDPSDLIVLAESQEGGLASAYYTPINVDARHAIHTEVLGSDFAGALAQDWATHSVQDNSFFAPSMPAPQLSAGPATAPSLDDDYKLVPDFAGRDLVIANPANGTVVTPGGAVYVAVEGGQTSGDTVAILYPGGALVDEIRYLGNARIDIPAEYIGEFPLMAFGERDDGRLMVSSSITLKVDPSMTVPPATVTAIRVEPTTVVLSGPGATSELRVMGIYSDGIEREVSSLSLGTAYMHTGQAIHVTPDGVVVGLAPGSEELLVRNTLDSWHETTVLVTVLDGAETNNPPHADAGGPYAACDSQLVYLDGSGSYDVDEARGDVLTYEWDLDADGEFDDANGPTPFVELRFAGEYWVIGLRVTDSQALTSTDYAYLEAGPGCLDGDFVCAIERPYNLAGVGTDASSNIYACEWGGGSIQRLVKFSPACDSVASADVTILPADMHVAADGTVFLSSGGSQILRYASDLTPLSPVSLESPYEATYIAVDAAGHIYGTDFEAGNQAVVRKYSSSGLLIASWEISQELQLYSISSPIAVGPDESIYFGIPPLPGTRVARGELVGNDYALDVIWGGPGVDAGLFGSTSDLAVGLESDLYVMDGQNERIQRFRSDSTFVRMWTGSGNPQGSEFSNAGLLAVGASGTIVVGETSFESYAIQVMNGTRPPLTAEITARTRLDTTLIYHEQPDTAASGCPQGDYDRMVISVAIDDGAIAGPIPKSAFSLGEPTGGAVFYAAEGADSDATLIDGKYRTTITVSQFGGCMNDSVTVKLNGAGIGKVALNVHSFDLATGGASHGKVDIVDLGFFTQSYPPNPYSACADYRPPADTVVNVVDLGVFTQHYFHEVGGGSGLVAGDPLVSQGVIRLDITEHESVEGRKGLYAKIILENVEPFAVMALALKTDNPAFKYRAWSASPSYPNRTLCVETVRDGVRQVFLAVVGSGESLGRTLELGELEFEAKQYDAAIRQFQLPGLINSAAKSTLHTPKQFTFKQSLWYRRTIQRDKVPLRI